MEIQDYEIEDLLTVLGSTFNIKQFKKYSKSSHTSKYNFKEYLNQLIDRKIIIKKNGEYEIIFPEY
jgi:hypothetical protein